MNLKWIEAKTDKIKVRCAAVETKHGIYFDPVIRSTVFIERNVDGKLEDERFIQFRDIPDSWLIDCLKKQIEKMVTEHKADANEFKDETGRPISDDMMVNSVEL